MYSARANGARCASRLSTSTIPFSANSSDVVVFVAGGSTGISVDLDLPVGTAHDGTGGIDSLVGIEDIVGSQLGDTITGDATANQLSGEDGADTIFGGDGADIIEGDGLLFSSNCDDTLYGGDGGDTLNGGIGDDILVGGNGVDIFVFGTFDGEATDTIVDFEDGVDSIGLSGGVTVASGLGTATVTLSSGTAIAAGNLDPWEGDDFFAI